MYLKQMLGGLSQFPCFPVALSFPTRPRSDRQFFLCTAFPLPFSTHTLLICLAFNAFISSSIMAGCPCGHHQVSYKACSRPHLFGIVCAHNHWLSLFSAGRPGLLKGCSFKCGTDVEWKEWRYTPGASLQTSKCTKKPYLNPKNSCGSGALIAAIDGRAHNQCSN